MENKTIEDHKRRRLEEDSDNIYTLTLTKRWYGFITVYAKDEHEAEVIAEGLSLDRRVLEKITFYQATTTPSKIEEVDSSLYCFEDCANHPLYTEGV